MTSLPALSYISNNARTEGEVKQALEDVIEAARESLGGALTTELTIATGSITPIIGSHTVDTQSDAASDDLDNIVTTNHPDGRLLLLRAQDTARTVIIKHNAGGAGQIALADAVDFSLDDTDKWILLKRTGADWAEIFRSQYPVGVLDRNVSAVTVVSTTTETDVWSFTVPANLLKTDRMLRVQLFGSFLNNTGGNETLTIRADFGGTEIFNGPENTIVASVNQRAWMVELRVIGRGTTATQFTYGHWWLSSAGTTAGNNADAGHGANVGRAAMHISVAEDSTIDRILKVSMQFPSTASANLSITRETAHLELV